MVIRANAMLQQFDSYVAGNTGRQALSTGFSNLDKLIKPAKNYFMVVSGYPGMGKSEFVDAVLLNMSLMHGWKTVYFSPENRPLEEHMAKIAERLIGKSIKKFSAKEIQQALAYIENHFTWIDPDNPTIDTILSQISQVKSQYGLDCAVIDPWNAIAHKRGQLREDEYLMEILSRMLAFARRHNIFLIICAHPKTIAPDKNRKLDAPTIADVSGGFMWWNKADYSVTVHRPDKSRNVMDVYVQKIKQKWMGNEGCLQLDYCRTTGRFKEKDAAEFTLPIILPCGEIMTELPFT